MVRKHSAGHSGLVYSEGGYFYPVDSGHHVSPTGIQTNQTSPSFPLVTTSGYFGTSTGNITTPSTRERHSPAMPYPPFTGVTTGNLRNSQSPVMAYQPFNGDQRVPPIASQYATVPRQPARYSMYYSPLNQQAFLVNSQHPNMRFPTSPDNMHGHGGVFVPISTTPNLQSTSNVPTTSGFVSTPLPGDPQRHDQLFNPLSSAHTRPALYTQHGDVLRSDPNISTAGTEPQNIPEITEPYLPSTSFTPVNTALQAGYKKAQAVLRDPSLGFLADDDYLKGLLNWIVVHAVII